MEHVYAVETEAHMNAQFTAVKFPLVSLLLFYWGFAAWPLSEL